MTVHAKAVNSERRTASNVVATKVSRKVKDMVAETVELKEYFLVER